MRCASMKEDVVGLLIFIVPAAFAVLLTLKTRAGFLVGWAVYLIACALLMGVAYPLVFNPGAPAAIVIFVVSWGLVVALVLFYLPVALIYAGIKEGFTVSGVAMVAVAIFLLGIVAIGVIAVLAGLSV